MAATVGHAAELLVVLVQEGARMAGHIAHRRAGHPVGIRQATDAVPAEDGVAGRARPAGQIGETVRSVAAGLAGSQNCRFSALI